MRCDDQYGIYPGLRGRTALVIRGASGIGEAILEAIARRQAQVAFLDLQQEAGKALVERLVDAGSRAPTFYRCESTFYCCDLTDVAAPQQTYVVDGSWV